MPLLYQLDEWKCEIAFNGFSRHLLLFAASFYGVWFGCPRDLTLLYKNIIGLTIVFLLIQTFLIYIDSMGSEIGFFERIETIYGIGCAGLLVWGIAPYFVFANYGVASEVGSIHFLFNFLRRGLKVLYDKV